MEQLWVEAWEHRVVALVHHAPHDDRRGERQRYVLDADRIQVEERQQARAQATGDHGRATADLVGQVTDKRNHQHRNDVADYRNPQVHALVEADAIGRLYRVGRTEDGGYHRDHVHQGHEHHQHHVLPAMAEGLADGRLGDFVLLLFLHERRGFVHFLTDDEAGNQHDGAHQEWNAPAPVVEGFAGHEVGQWQEHGRRQHLASLYALQGEAGVVAPSTEWRMFHDHRTGTGNFTGHGKALDQAQHHQQGRGEQADVVVGGQQAHGHGRQAHQEHAQQQYVLAAAGVTPVAQHEGAERARQVTHAVGGQRGNDGHFRVGVREEDLRENQRSGLGVDEEVVVLECRAYPSTGGRFLGLRAGVSHRCLRCYCC